MALLSTVLSEQLSGAPDRDLQPCCERPETGEHPMAHLQQLKSLVGSQGIGDNPSQLQAGMDRLLGTEPGPADRNLTQNLVDTVSPWTQDIAGPVNDRIRYLEQSLQISPQRARSMYEAKQSINQAAVLVIEHAIGDRKGDRAGMAVLEAPRESGL